VENSNEKNKEMRKGRYQIRGFRRILFFKLVYWVFSLNLEDDLEKRSPLFGNRTEKRCAENLYAEGKIEF
jgi:hypothetical protein